MVIALSTLDLRPRPKIDTPFEKPSSKTQLLIADIWKSLLGLEEIGINDSFFELGGTSLKAVEMISRLKNDHGLLVSVINLFEKPDRNLRLRV